MLEAIALDAITGIGEAALSTRAERSTAASAAKGVAPAFDSVLGQVANDAIGAVKNGEAVSIAGMKGSASAQQVVDAVMTAERSLQLAIAVRDKVVAAYQDMTRMAI